ncbi:MAG TPA: PDDEXK nuclease domain-containing protein [Chitinophagaceae bacterium]|nr:PDDEXK nuclease domain-containing protein [Chitinophagaceae bacterium]
MAKQKNKYQQIVESLKEKIRLSRMQATTQVNHLLIKTYWEIGTTILQQEKEEGWGAGVVANLAADLKAAFPDMKGLSQRNLTYMRNFAAAYPCFPILQAPLAKLTVAGKRKQADNTASSILQAPLAKLSWYHHITLLDKVKDEKERVFYIYKTIENGWSRNVMVHQVESRLYKRQGKAITNFKHTLLPLQSDLANEMVKSPYLFDFLGLGDEVQERELEKALIQHIKKFMLELGKGFAYVGNQYNLQVEGDEYFLDLLFYNYLLHRFVVFELKVGEFKPEYAGKLNFYINTIDGQIKTESHQPTIGILLCKTPNKTVVKYALQGMDTPIGVAEYQLTRTLPRQLKSGIPSIAELEAEMNKGYKQLKKPVKKKKSVKKKK